MYILHVHITPTGTFMSDWIGRQSPQILSRVDEDDVELWHYMHYTTGLYIVLTCCSYSLYCRITTSIHYLKRFGRHPEDWYGFKQSTVHGDTCDLCVFFVLGRLLMIV